MKIIVITICAVLIFSNIHMSDSILGDLVVTVKPESSSLSTNEFPIIVGYVTDQASKPIADVKIKIALATETVITSTNSNGTFIYEYSKTSMPGNYQVNVIATKDGYGMDIVTTSYYVHGAVDALLEKNPINQTHAKIVTDENNENDPIAKMMLKHEEKNMKELELQEQKQAEIEEQKKFIEEQRKKANESLQNELKKQNIGYESNSTKNAFMMFISGIDEFVQDIFWGQFNFTTQKIKEAHEAKMQVLENGGSMEEARKAYNEKMSISRNQLIELNNELLQNNYTGNKTQANLHN